MSKPSLATQLEAILFVAAGPLPLGRLAAATGSGPEAAQQALAQLAQRLQSGGLRLSQLGDSYQITTAPELAGVVRTFLQEESRSELSRAALETLAIVAYRGPVTKGQIEAIRGVSSDTMIRNLLGRGLIAEAGRSQEPGRPIQYGVSHSFLQHFGLTSPDDLPPVPAGHETPQPAAAGREAHGDSHAD